MKQTISNNRKKEPFPYAELSILAVVNLTSSMVASSLFPYIAFMVVDLGLVNNINVAGYYAGTISSSLFAGRLISSYYWGVIADTYGRKPVLYVACTSLSILSIVFGLSTNIYIATISRFILGNKNINII
jgi:MFS family permease